MSSPGTPSQPAEAGESMDAKAAESSTPVIGGGRRHARRAASGGPTSRRSNPPSTPPGKKPAPEPEAMPEQVRLVFQTFAQKGAVEYIYLRGEALVQLAVGTKSVYLVPGHWALGRWRPGPTVEPDGTVKLEGPLVVIFGAGTLQNRAHQLELDQGVWLVQRLPDDTGQMLDDRCFYGVIV